MPASPSLGDLNTRMAAFGFAGGLVDTEVAQVFESRGYDQPRVIAPRILTAGPEDPNGYLFQGNSPAAGAIAAGTTLLDLTAGTVAIDPQFRTLSAGTSKAALQLYIEGIRLELIPPDAATMTHVDDYLSHTIFKFSSSSTPDLVVPAYKFGGTALSVEAPAVGAPASLTNSARKTPSTYWFDDPFAVDYSTDTLGLFADGLGFTLGGAAVWRQNMFVYGSIWQTGFGKLGNARLALTTEQRGQRRGRRMGKVLLHSTVRGGNGGSFLGGR